MITPPEANQPVAELWRTVRQCVAFCNAIENLVVKINLEKLRVIITADGAPTSAAVGIGTTDKVPTTGRLQIDGGKAVLLLE